MTAAKLFFLGAVLAFAVRPVAVEAHSPEADTGYMQYGEAPVRDNSIFYHLLFDQLEGRTNGIENEFRWDGEGWIGTDFNRLWLKSEGFVERGRMTDGDQEALYDRPIPFLRYFDVQAGVRYDLDSNPGRAWGAIGIEGLAPYFFEFAPTFYFSNRGFFAGRIEGSYDILITQRLIAQPQFELNFYSKNNPSREIGSGLSELDAGLRVRYEFSRKLAPYLGFAYTGTYGTTAVFTRRNRGNSDDPRFIFGMRVWY
ncbi:MAG TPA: copper resistance protein B [Candidatus Binataceae bacterium]|nr:copper resistance protein B [Candidatus Binataceae bacterium]